MSIKHGSTKPTLCAVCGSPINAGTGLFTVEGGGVLYVHAGRCAFSVGAFPGGSAAVWGERGALASAMIAANDGISEAEAAGSVKWREPEGGFVAVDLLEALIVVLGVLVLGLAIVGGSR